MEYIKLNNGVEMPTLGYGVFLVSPEECERCGRKWTKRKEFVLSWLQYFALLLYPYSPVHQHQIQEHGVT